MRSVADEVRREHAERSAALAPEERIRLALQLGELELELYCRREGLDRAAAVRQIRMQRQVGRRLSRCMLEALD